MKRRRNVRRRNGTAPSCPAPNRRRRNGGAEMSLPLIANGVLLLAMLVVYIFQVGNIMIVSK